MSTEKKTDYTMFSIRLRYGDEREMKAYKILKKVKDERRMSAYVVDAILAYYQSQEDQTDQNRIAALEERVAKCEDQIKDVIKYGDIWIPVDLPLGEGM